ncbi:DMT family transporter [Hydrocarboniclastica marina]|uniref:DMT family transporter n=1 Tax=Hydrocarboniclastica marina TaxID=2259620 RepID=A0A4P7XJS8_9ALTE|nr:DMT family transporter [Hydrocarboniclastica marina]MAM00119.1 multidrug DMT transporter permease [Alteromonadaceae bacterium]QCF27429.1 DMT family transporter [Hydrocarboniclastica marina]
MAGQAGTTDIRQPGPVYAWRNGYVLLAFTALTWGINFPILKIGLEYSPPLLYTTLRMLLGTVTMFMIAAFMGILRRPHRADVPVIFSVGLLQNMGFIGLVTVGLQFMPAGRAAILAYTSPIWVVPAAVLFLGERFTFARALGTGLGLAGLMAIFNPFSVNWGEPGALLGGGLIVLATMLWTVGLVHVRRHQWRGDVLSLIPWQLLVSTVFLLPIALILENSAAIRWEQGFLVNIFFSGAFASGLCVAAQVGAIRSLPAVSLSLGSAAVPAVGMVSSYFILNEHPGAWDIVGFCLIGLGLLVVGLADRRQARGPVPDRLV